MIRKGYRLFAGIGFCLMLLNFSVNAQLIDTIQYSLRQRPKVFVTLASFNTYIDRQYANIFRLKMGLSYNQRIRFGISYSNLANNAVVSTIHVSENNYEYDTNGRLNFSFVSVSSEYFFYINYPWQFTLTPIHIGVGGANYEYINRTEHTQSFTPTETIILYQPEVSAQLNIFNWLGIGATTGYRVTLYRSNKSTQHLNAPLFAVDFRIFLEELYTIYFKSDRKSE